MTLAPAIFVVAVLVAVIVAFAPTCSASDGMTVGTDAPIRTTE
jgi:hypothetical protein